MAVMQPRENVYISTQIENITEFVFVCVCARTLRGCLHHFTVIHSLPACLIVNKFRLWCLFHKNNIDFALKYKVISLLLSTNVSIYLYWLYDWIEFAGVKFNEEVEHIHLAV